MNYKFSNFNCLVKNKEDEYIVFNTLTLSLAVVNKIIRDFFIAEDIQGLISSLNKNEIKMFYQNGIIVKDSYDEIQYLKEAYSYNRLQDDTLHISILTTLGCNFACPYCFETRRNVKLTTDVENAIIEFIRQKSGGKKFVHVDWYGGEPLLNFEAIERISRNIINLAKQNKFKYYSSITTNGYLLTPDIITKLKKLKVKSAQITLDGAKSFHDKMRPLANHNGTFDVILGNIKNASKHFKINLRININKENRNSIYELFHNLVGIENLCLAIKAIVPASYKTYNKQTLEAKEYAKIVVKAYFYAKKLGLKTAIDNLFQGSMHRYCIVDSDSQFIISPTGKIFKCGESYLDDEKGIVGGLNNKKELVVDSEKIKFWNKDPFGYSECLGCKVLPLCYGGCQMKRKIKNTESCSPEYKYTLKELIKAYYKSLGVENET